MTDRLDDIFSTAVLEPWQKACSDSPTPWAAPRSLRQYWREMTESSSVDEALCGALALIRTSSISDEERAIVERFFNKKDSLGDFSPLLVASMLLSGANLPHLFLQSYISLSLNDSSPLQIWELLSRYLRHPATALFEREKMFPLPPLPRVAFLLDANPLRPAGLDSKLGVWGTCQVQFKGPRSRPSPSSPELVLLAHTLRCDWGSSELKEWLSNSCLPRRISTELSFHPCLSRPCPHIDHLNPGIHAIEFFSGSDGVSRVWRFYNPLLILPWLMDPTPASTELERIGCLMLGDIPSLQPGSPGNVPLIDSHPLRLLTS